MPEKRGRPDKLTPEVARQITNAIGAGNYIDTGAAFGGISKVTFYAWLRRGRREKTGKYRQLVRDVEKAAAQAEVRDVSVIARAAEKDWRAAAWRLERRHPSRWGRRLEPGSSGSRKERKRPWKAQLKPQNLKPQNPETKNPEAKNPEAENPEA